MPYFLLFCLLGLTLAGFREGVWKLYTPLQLARLRMRGAQEAAAPRPVAPRPVQTTVAAPAKPLLRPPATPARRPVSSPSFATAGYGR